jgi:glycosyltransferase involved in cell wall biosynthesis
MRIAIAGSRGFPYVYSGYETLVSELAVRLRDKGHDVRVYCHRELFPVRPERVEGISLVYVPGIASKTLSQFSHSLLSSLHIITHRPDVVLYVNSANGPFGLLTLIAGVPSAINVDGLEWKRPKWRGIGAYYFKFASFLSTKLFTRVITDSDRMAEIYRDVFGANSDVIAYGADTGFSSSPELIKQFGIESNEYFLVVGRMIPDNNVLLIVRAFAATNLKKKLVVLGGVPYKDTYAEEVTAVRDDRIIFPGYVRDKDVLRELYCNCYAYVHGHEFGGTNPALLKALGYGCGILALDTLFNREVLMDGKHGLFFPKSEGELSILFGAVASEEERIRGMRATARERIASRYTWGRVADEYESLFEKLARH